MPASRHLRSGLRNITTHVPTFILCPARLRCQSLEISLHFTSLRELGLPVWEVPR
jgi:hypothetical protein